MIFMRVMSKAIILTFLSFAVVINSEAKSTEDIVLCPKPDKIHQAAALLNQVVCQEGYCVVTTDNNPAFYENGLYWRLSLMNRITAASKDEAVFKAQKIAREVTVMFSETVFMNVLCGYYVTSSDLSNNEVIGIFAWGLNMKHQIPLMHFLLGN